MEIEVKEIAPQPVLSVRGRTTMEGIASFMDESLPKVTGYMEGHDIMRSGPPFTRYHEVSDQGVEIEVGVPVLESSEGEGEVQPSELPGGRVAAAIHSGPYEGLGEVHAAIEKWIEEQDEAVSGGAWEVYWTNAAEEPDQSQWKTEVVWPLR